MLNWTCR